MNEDKWCQANFCDSPNSSLVDTLILRPESKSGNGQPDLAWLDGCLFGCQLPPLIREHPGRQPRTCLIARQQLNEYSVDCDCDFVEKPG